MLQFDHVNGDKNDNSKINLRAICPNCHTQTHNFGIKNCKLLLCNYCNKEIKSFTYKRHLAACSVVRAERTGAI